ncbi:MAG: TAXI family TRAP transporter solute-binding subunit [Sulfitobacter sp.]|nr:TAXI family TRAP transporter solute-binding subunit [Sulfitobacter sp.]
MKPTKLMAALVAATTFATGAFAQANLTAETSSPGGATHLSPAHLTEIAGTRGIANIQLADGQTLTNSIQNVAEGKTDIAGTPHILPFLMSRGVGPYGSLGKEKGAELASNLRAINPFTLGIFLLYAYDAKGLTGWDDLEGRKIYNGPPRGGALTNARTMIQLVAGLNDGEGYEGIQTNWGQGAALVTSGEPDAVVLPELFPGSRLSTVASAGKMTGWSMPKEAYESEAMQKYMQAPGSAPVEMSLAELQETMGDDWTFVSEDDTFRGFATIGGNVVHKDMDDDLVHELVTAYIDTLDELKAKAPYGKTVNFDNPMLGMCGANPIKYHPAAARAWREAGYTLEDCAVAAD